MSQSLPFQKVEHQVATLDAQPSNPQGGIMVVVSGALLVRTCARRQSQIGRFLIFLIQVEEERRPMSYVQTFQLLPNGEGSYYVFNDVFRLVYPASG